MKQQVSTGTAVVIVVVVVLIAAGLVYWFMGRRGGGSAPIHLNPKSLGFAPNAVESSPYVVV